MPDTNEVSLRRQVRVLSILSAAARAGFEGLSSPIIQVIAYFADALAPVWSFVPETSEVLKLTDGPFDPAVQRELDYLTARGLLIASDLQYISSPSGHLRLEGRYEANQART